MLAFKNTMLAFKMRNAARFGPFRTALAHEPAPLSFRSPRYPPARTSVSITFEEAARLQTGFSSPVYLLVYPPEGRGVYVGSWIRVQERYPSAVGEPTTLGEGRRWLIKEGFPERYFDAI